MLNWNSLLETLYHTYEKAHNIFLGEKKRVTIKYTQNHNFFLEVYIHRPKNKNYLKIQDYAMKVTIVYIWFLSLFLLNLTQCIGITFITRSILRVFCFNNKTQILCQSIRLSLPFSLPSWLISFIGLLFFPQKRNTGGAMANGKSGRVKRKERTDNTSRL